MAFAFPSYTLVVFSLFSPPALRRCTTTPCRREAAGEVPPRAGLPGADVVPSDGIRVLPSEAPPPARKRTDAPGVVVVLPGSDLGQGEGGRRGGGGRRALVPGGARGGSRGAWAGGRGDRCHVGILRRGGEAPFGREAGERLEPDA
ncbi:hypothetical protein B296_00020674 [Ensete ventricosum]|uniref:Uncharacterized protein n=1 Tax=Ensete ventricosum TaxID=4639 RepID=A0A426ZJK9_ENSVE|nr:hypothetical protein B296_00020674 [Ensete ventricosum]